MTDLITPDLVMPDLITTERLTLRPFKASDAPAVQDALRDKQIARMIPMMPWPYSARDAQYYVEHTAPNEPRTLAIERDGRLDGSIGIGPQFGYWLRKGAWGKGIATEAARAILAAHFQTCETDVSSSYRLENTASRKVLAKLGFKNRGQHSVYCMADACDITMQDVILTRSDWEAHL